jgi:hypothetical protein
MGSTDIAVLREAKPLQLLDVGTRRLAGRIVGGKHLHHLAIAQLGGHGRVAIGLDRAADAHPVAGADALEVGTAPFAAHLAVDRPSGLLVAIDHEIRQIRLAPGLGSLGRQLHTGEADHALDRHGLALVHLIELGRLFGVDLHEIGCCDDVVLVLVAAIEPSGGQCGKAQPERKWTADVATKRIHTGASRAKPLFQTKV